MKFCCSLLLKICLTQKINIPVYKNLNGDIMCTVGGPMADIKMKKLKTKRYKCMDCGNEFKGIGKKVICPSCQSDNVEELS